LPETLEEYGCSLDEKYPNAWDRNLGKELKALDKAVERCQHKFIKWLLGLNCNTPGYIVRKKTGKKLKNNS